MTAGKESRYTFVWACLILLAGCRFGRSASRRFKMGMPQSSCSRRNTDDRHYFPYPAYIPMGLQKKCSYGVSTLADVLILLRVRSVSN